MAFQLPSDQPSAAALPAAAPTFQLPSDPAPAAGFTLPSDTKAQPPDTAPNPMQDYVKYLLTQGPGYNSTGFLKQLPGAISNAASGFTGMVGRDIAHVLPASAAPTLQEIQTWAENGRPNMPGWSKAFYDQLGQPTGPRWGDGLQGAAEGMRDIGMTGLGIMAPGTAGLAANIGIPALMEASNANRIIPGIGQLAAHLGGVTNPQYEFDPATYNAQPTPALKQQYLKQQLEAYQGQLARQAMTSPEMSTAEFQSLLMGAPMLMSHAPTQAAAEPLVPNAEPLAPATNNTSLPSDSSLFRSGAKAVGASFLLPSDMLRTERMAEAVPPWGGEAAGPAEAQAADAAITQLQGDRAAAKVTANAAYDSTANALSPVEDRYARNIMQATPRMPVPQDGADLTTPEGQSGRYNTYLADAVDQISQRRGTTELTPAEHAAAQAIALGRLSEDMSAQHGIVSNPATWQNNPVIRPQAQDLLNQLTQQGVIQTPNLNAAEQALRLDPANMAAPATSARPSGAELASQRQAQLEELDRQIAGKAQDPAEVARLQASIAQQRAQLPANPRADVAAAARLAPTENMPVADPSAQALSPDERASNQAVTQQVTSKAYKVMQAAFDALPEGEQAARVRLAASQAALSKLLQGPDPAAMETLVKARDALQAVSDRAPEVTKNWLDVTNEMARLEAAGARGYARALHPQVLVDQALKDIQQTSHGNVSSPTSTNMREQTRVYGARQNEAGLVEPQTTKDGTPILTTADGEDFLKRNVPGLVEKAFTLARGDAANADLTDDQLRAKLRQPYDEAQQKTLTRRPLLEASASLRDQLAENLQTAATTRFFSTLAKNSSHLLMDDAALDADGPKGSGDARRAALKTAGWRYLGDENTTLSPVHGDLAGKWMHPDLYDAWKPQQEARTPSAWRTLSNYIISRPVKTFSNVLPWAFQKNLMASVALGLPIHEWGNILERGRNAANDPQVGFYLRQMGIVPEGRPSGQGEAMVNRPQPQPGPFTPGENPPSGSVVNPDLGPAQEAQTQAKLAAKGRPVPLAPRGHAPLSIAEHVVNFLDSAQDAAASLVGGNVKGVVQKGLQAVGVEPPAATEKLPEATIPSAELYRSPSQIKELQTKMDDLQNAGIFHWLLDRQTGAGLDPAKAMRIMKEQFLFPSESSGLARGLQSFGAGGLGTRYANWTVNATAQFAHLLTNANPVVLARAWALPAALVALRAGAELSASQQQLAQRQKAQATAGGGFLLPSQAPGEFSATNIQNAWHNYNQRQAVRPDRLQFPNNLLQVPLGPAPDRPGSDRQLEANVGRYMPWDTAFDLATSARNIIDHPSATDSEHNILANLLDVAPFSRPIMDLVRNEDAWRGGPIIDPALPITHPQNVRNLAEFMGGSLLPSNAPFGSQDIMAGRIANQGAPTNVYGASGLRIDRPQSSLNNMTGLRVAGTSYTNDLAAAGHRLEEQEAATKRLPKNSRYSLNNAEDLVTGGAQQLQNLLQRYRMSK